MIGLGVAVPQLAVRRRGIAGGAGSGVVPLNGRLVLAGDSITAAAIIVSGLTTTYATAGWARWMLHAIDNRVRVPSGGMLAVSGNNLSQIATSMGAGASTTILTGLAPDMIAFMGGTNNLGGATLQQLKDGFDACAAKMLASAATLIMVLGVLPQKAGALTTQQNQNRLDYNSWLAGWVAAHAARAVFVDTDAIGLVDGDFVDNVHPRDSGAKKIGEAAAAAISARIASGNVVSDTAGLAIFTPNPTFTGNSSGRGTGWTATVSGAGGATVAFAKEAGTDAQLVTISGSYSGTGRQVMLENSPTTATITGPAAGDELEALADIDLLAAPVGLNVIDAFYNAYSSGFQDVFTVRSDLPVYDAAKMAGAAGKLILRSAAIKRPATPTPFTMPNRIFITLIDAPGGASVDIQLRINRFEARKVA